MSLETMTTTEEANTERNVKKASSSLTTQKPLDEDSPEVGSTVIYYINQYIIRFAQTALHHAFCFW